MLHLAVIPGAREPEPARSVTLKLWKTGFSLDEGPVRDYHNPANKEFLEYIKRGYRPFFFHLVLATLLQLLTYSFGILLS